MTGLWRPRAHCNHCGVPLKLGDTPRPVAYPLVIAVVALGVVVETFFFPGWDPTSLPSLAAFIAVAFPLALLIGWVRGVELDASRMDHDEPERAAEKTIGTHNAG